jgi:hypothetical protein
MSVPWDEAEESGVASLEWPSGEKDMTSEASEVLPWDSPCRDRFVVVDAMVVIGFRSFSTPDPEVFLIQSSEDGYNENTVASVQVPSKSDLDLLYHLAGG